MPDVKVMDSQLARAAELAKAMTADPVTGTGPEWTVGDVLSLALVRGLDALERTYLKGGGDE